MKVILERRGRSLLAWILGVLAPVHKVQPSDGRDLLRKTAGAKILFIRPHQGLGDLLLATPIFRALKKAYPAVQIHFLADTYNAVAVRGNPRIDRLWIWDKKRMRNPLHFLVFLRSLRAEGFALAVPLSSHVPSFTSYLIARLSGAKMVWAYETQPFYGGANWSRRLSHTELPNRPETDPEWVKFMALVRPLMGPPPATAGNDVDYTPEFEVGADNETWACEEWRTLGLSGDHRKKIGLFFGGNPDRPERLWTPSYWTELARLVQADPRLSLVVIVPPGNLLSGSRAKESGIFGEVAGHLQTRPAVFSHSQLDRVAAFLKGLDLFVCVDGGLFHIAVASRVRTLGLFFVTDPARWAPPVPWQTVLRPPDDLPSSLPPAEVYQKIGELMLKSTLITNA
jgi:ADP-heptose:LPS heptosyltransferase